jgi:O-antigen/teichoic acid export membrane protein
MRILAVEDYGSIEILGSFIVIFAVFVQGGLNTAITRSKNVDARDLSSVFLFSLALATMLYVVIFFVAPFVAQYFSSPILEPALRVLAIQLILNSLYSVLVAKVTRDLEFQKLFKSTMSAVCVSGIFGITAAYLGFGVWALVLQQLIFLCISTLVLFILVDWKPRLTFNWIRFKEFFSFGWKILCSTLIDVGSQKVYSLVIARLFSSSDLGIFTSGQRFPSLLSSLFDGSLQSVMLPTMARFQDDKKQLAHILQKTLTTSVFCLIPLMAILAITATPLISLLLTEKWLPCVPFVQLFCISYVLWPIHTSNLQAINALGRSDLFFKLEVAKAIISLTILAIATSIFQNIITIAYGFLLVSCLGVIINSFPMKKLLNYGLFAQLRDIIPYYVLGIVSAAIAMTLSIFILNPLLRIVCESVTLLGSYCLLNWALKLPAFTTVYTIFTEYLSLKKRTLR